MVKLIINRNAVVANVSCVLMDALAAGGAEAKRTFAAMMDMGKIDLAKIESARRG